MAYKLSDYWAGLKWIMAEKGLQNQWNVMTQVMNSKLGTSLVAGTTVVGDIDLIAAEDTTGLKSNGARSGPFISTNANSGAFLVVPADPSGFSGSAEHSPVPDANTPVQRLPKSGGFRQ